MKLFCFIEYHGSKYIWFYSLFCVMRLWFGGRVIGCSKIDLLFNHNIYFTEYVIKTEIFYPDT